MPSADYLIASFVAGTRFEDIPMPAVHEGRRAILDTVAAILAGSASETIEPLLRFVRAQDAGTYPVLGTGLMTSSSTAALANGTIAHAIDFDDTVSSMPGHPGSFVLPAITSALGTEPLSGAGFLTAYIVGYEAATKLGRAIGMGHYQRGWHSTGTIGVFGRLPASLVSCSLMRAPLAKHLA
jgi:2-methylcitrate dehydratase PrpD